MPTIEKNKIPTPTKFQKYCEKLINRYFEQMTEGKLKLIKPSGEVYIYGNEKSADSATIEVSSYEFYTRCVLYGDIGFGESYVEGQWHTDNITEVVSWFILNTRKNQSKALNSARSFFINSLGTINSIRHKFRSNTIKNSKINIHEHYDLGNEFYKIFLDETMTYSCAYFEDKNQSLNEAQESKYDILCRKLKIQESDAVLEIGSGWGGFAEYAATNYGCSVKGITISKEQLNFSNERILKKNLQQKVNFELIDYRNIGGKYDKIVSIEMMEAVGDEFLEDYFKQCDRLLNKDGLLGLQIITCPDSRYNSLRKGNDWTQKHIFPGSLLLANNRMAEAMSKVSNLFLHSWEEFSHNYYRTLMSWHERFNNSLDTVRSQGFSEEFIRKWNYYLCYCAAGFNMRNVGVAQGIYSRPNNLTLR